MTLDQEINTIYNYATQNYCTDQMFNWAYNITKNRLAAQGQGNAEPSRRYMICIIIERLTKDIYEKCTSGNYLSVVRNHRLSDQQIQEITTEAAKADGQAATYGGAAAGAGAGYMLGGFLGAAIGGIAGALFGNSYNNQNRQKFYDVLRRCISLYTSALYQNNYQSSLIAQKKYEQDEQDFVRRLTEFGEKMDLTEEELYQFGQDALKIGINIATIADFEDAYYKTYPDKKPKTKIIDEKAETIEELLEQLNSLTGLTTVKDEIKKLVSQTKVFKMRQAQGLPNPGMSYHLVFTGNPGTGKTTVARLVAKIYKALGILDKGQLIETDRSGLVGGYVGQTALKTKEVINKALGGVLFIDEAYSLKPADDSGNDFGQEAIDTILKAMEDNRDNLVVIAAGYDREMERFIFSNPGLKSRFKTFIHFEDYTGPELYEIFVRQCEKFNYILTEKAKARLQEYFEDLYATRGYDFANGRDVRNLFERVVTLQSQRVSAKENASKTYLQTIGEKDLPFATDE